MKMKKFQVGDRVVHFTGSLWGTVVGWAEHDGIEHLIVKHEDPFYRDEDDGITHWLPKVLSKARGRWAPHGV